MEQIKNFLNDERFYIGILVIATVVMFFIPNQATKISPINVKEYNYEDIAVKKYLPALIPSSASYEKITLPEGDIYSQLNLGRANPFDNSSSGSFNTQLP